MGTRRSRWTISATWLIYGPMPWTFLFRHMGTARIAKGERPIASWSDQRQRSRLARCSSLRPLGVRADHYRWSVRERRSRDYFCHVAHLRAHALDLPVPPHGDCAYCEGGTAYRELVRSAEALKAGKMLFTETARSTSRPLPIVSAGAAVSTGGCSSGGCTSCGLAAAHSRAG